MTRRILSERLGPLAAALAMLAGFAGAGRALAANVLTNPGFETGSFLGWTVGGNSIQTGVAVDGTLIPNSDSPFSPSFVNVRSGSFAGHALVKDGNDPVERIVLSQTVAVPPNSNVDVGFWLGNDSQDSFGLNVDDSHLQIFIDGVGLLPNDFLNGGIIGGSPADFHLFSGSFNSLNHSSITVAFAINGSGTSRVGVSFDDFFVNAVPEPSAIVLAASGLALLLGCARRRPNRQQRSS